MLSVVAQYYHHIYYVHISSKIICIGFKNLIYKINNHDNVSLTRTVVTTTLFSATACKKMHRVTLVTVIKGCYYVYLHQ